VHYWTTLDFLSYFPIGMAARGDEIGPIHNTPHAYFIFGRFNPPTIGHKVLIDNLIGMSRAHHSDAYVFATSTQDAKKNPLRVEEKVEILKMMYPDPATVRIINTTEKGCRTIPAVLAALRGAGYDALTLVAGSDRVPEFRGKFKDLAVVSGGERDPDANDAAGMSATIARSAAIQGRLEDFERGINNSVTRVKKKETYNTIRARMGAKGGRRARRVRRTRRHRR
jgi:hypothetical protein